MHTATAVPSPSKTELRAHALQLRRAYARSLTPEARGALETQLVNRVVPHLGAAGAVAAYYPLRDEIDPLPILAAFVRRGRVAGLPWFAHRDALMMFRRAPAETPGPWGMLQPSADAVAVSPEIVLVPLVATDLNCNRIGHGKGHYDRALANLRAVGPVSTIGLAWDIQVLENVLSPDPWDIPLDAVATPDRWIERAHA